MFDSTLQIVIILELDFEISEFTYRILNIIKSIAGYWYFFEKQVKCSSNFQGKWRHFHNRQQKLVLRLFAEILIGRTKKNGGKFQSKRSVFSDRFYKVLYSAK